MTKTAPLTTYLAELACDIAASPLPEPVEQKAKLCLLDFLAACMAGLPTEVARTGLATLPAFGDGDSTVLTHGERTSLLGAAFFHGLIATVEDVDDSHRFASGLHLSALTFPVALALGEAKARSGAQVLRAATVGYEVASRLCRAVDAGLRERGFHSTGAVGPFGACATARALLGLDPERTARALGIAASGAGGLFAFLPEGATVRHAHGAWAASNGLMAALLAEHGLTGPGLAIEGKDGFLRAYATRCDEDFLRAPFPSQTGSYEIANAYHKLFSSCGHALPAITAVLELRDQVAARLDDIQGIDIRAYKASAALTNPDPASVGEAKFSLPFITALALLYGDVTTQEMRMDVLQRPEVRRLADLVAVSEDPKISADFPRLRSAELAVNLTDGTSLRKYVDAPIGMPENPVGWDQIAKKFRLAADGILSASTQDAVLSEVEGLERASSLNSLMRLVGTAPSTLPPR